MRNSTTEENFEDRFNKLGQSLDKIRERYQSLNQELLEEQIQNQAREITTEVLFMQNQKAQVENALLRKKVEAYEALKKENEELKDQLKMTKMVNQLVDYKEEEYQANLGQMKSKIIKLESVVKGLKEKLASIKSNETNIPLCEQKIEIEQKISPPTKNFLSDLYHVLLNDAIVNLDLIDMHPAIVSNQTFLTIKLLEASKINAEKFLQLSATYPYPGEALALLTLVRVQIALGKCYTQLIQFSPGHQSKRDNRQKLKNAIYNGFNLLNSEQDNRLAPEKLSSGLVAKCRDYRKQLESLKINSPSIDSNGGFVRFEIKPGDQNEQNPMMLTTVFVKPVAKKPSAPNGIQVQNNG